MQVPYSPETPTRPKIQNLTRLSGLQCLLDWANVVLSTKHKFEEAVMKFRPLSTLSQQYLMHNPADEKYLNLVLVSR
jgi:hypothetical protein